MIRIQSKIRSIQKELSDETDLPVSDIELITSSMWEALKEFIEKDQMNAVYLRHLGTFYGKKEMVEKLNEFRKIKNGTGQL